MVAGLLSVFVAQGTTDGRGQQENTQAQFVPRARMTHERRDSLPHQVRTALLFEGNLTKGDSCMTLKPVHLGAERRRPSCLGGGVVRPTSCSAARPGPKNLCTFVEAVAEAASFFHNSQLKLTLHPSALEESVGNHKPCDACSLHVLTQFCYSRAHTPWGKTMHCTYTRAYIRGKIRPFSERHARKPCHFACDGDIFSICVVLLVTRSFQRVHAEGKCQQLISKAGVTRWLPQLVGAGGRGAKSRKYPEILPDVGVRTRSSRTGPNIPAPVPD